MSHAKGSKSDAEAKAELAAKLREALMVKQLLALILAQREKRRQRAWPRLASWQPRLQSFKRLAGCVFIVYIAVRTTQKKRRLLTLS